MPTIVCNGKTVELIRQVIAEPMACGICGTATRRRQTVGIDEVGAATECPNADCPAKKIGRLKNWIRKLDILGVGDEVLMALVKAGINEPADLYEMVDSKPASAIADMKIGKTKFGLKRATALYGQIAAKRTMPLHVFIGSLGLTAIGRRRAQLMMEAAPGCFDSVEKWLDGSNLRSNAAKAGVPRVVDQMIASVESMKPNIERLAKLVVIAADVPKPAPTSGTLSGRSFCFTGKIERLDDDGKRYTRDMMQKLVTDAGGSAVDDVKAGVTLVQADPSSSSSKSQKAKKLGCTIMSEADFFKLFGM